MNMRKRTLIIVIFVLLVSMTMSLIGCSKKQGSGGSTVAQNKSESSQEQDKGKTTSEGDENSSGSGEEKVYEPHYSYTCSTHSTLGNISYTDDGLYKFFSNKYNIDVEVWPVSRDAMDEKQRIWINSGTLPDFLTWQTFNYQEYMNYVEQGLIAPLPDGWEERFPNLAAMVKKSGIYDYLVVDGKIYGIPHTTFAVFIDMDRIVSHASIYYRKDWVEKLGLKPFGYAVTLSQLEEYIRGCINENLSGGGITYGLTGAAQNIVDNFMNFAGVDYDGIVEVNGKAELGAKLDGVVEAIALAREWYKKGLINPDFYILDSAQNRELMTGGLAAAFRDSGPVNGYFNLENDFVKANPDKELTDIGIAAMADDNGVTYINETTNFWSMTLFNPEIEEDKQLRLMEIMDWLCTKEGQYYCQLGLYDVEWVYDNSGKIKVIRQPNEKGELPSQYDVHPSYRIWRCLGVLTDSFSFENPAFPEHCRKDVLAVYDEKEKGVIIPFNYDYYLYASDLKSQFSMDFRGEVIRLMTTDGDIEKEWNDFIEKNRNMWEPLLNELNTVLYK